LAIKVGLLDADVYGPNVPIMLGATQQPEATSEQAHHSRAIARAEKVISMGC